MSITSNSPTFNKRWACCSKDDKLLGEMEQIAESHYRVGQGNQSEVLKAQLQHTRILQEITMHHREAGQVQAQIKQLFGRAQDSTDIVDRTAAGTGAPSQPCRSVGSRAATEPEVAFRNQVAKRSDKQIELAKKEFRPDFGLEYMYQNTDRKFRDYYMLTLTVTLPNRGRRQSELAAATEHQHDGSLTVECRDSNGIQQKCKANTSLPKPQLSNSRFIGKD